MHRKTISFTACLLAGALAASPPVAAAQDTATPAAAQAHPALWPAVKSGLALDPATERKITALLRAMSLEEKIGQMIQADLSTIRPDDLRRYPLGSILAGGSTPPLDAPDRSPAGPWVATARAFRAVAMERRPGHQPIPLMFGIDAVHGNNNVVGATLFPHNIALGAAQDPDLVRRIGEATARETAAADIDWAFGPTLAVPQNDRWGRTFEGYSERPEIVRAYAGAMVEGLQGKPGADNRIQTGHVAASVKHFLGDGGTTDGVDQGNTQVPESELIAIHNAGYPNAIRAGAMTVMASFNSWNGQKMHGNRSLLTDVLKGRMGFTGFIVGDWNGHAQVPGCSNVDCPASFNAGLDMAMAPDGWKGLFDNTLREVRSGQIPMARVDDAVRRILRVKFRLGLFDPARPLAGQDGVLGSPAHRALAREAVRKSLVLLKNDGVLPVRANARVLVAGPAADDIGLQSGGWTLSWQGEGNTNADFPNAQSIYAGIAQAVKAGGGSATLSRDGTFTQKPDVAIVVFGETPYAEGVGDVKTLEFQAGDKQALALLKRLRAAGVPTVSVFLSGRPLWVNPELNQSDAFVAAWLPGSDGGGIADVLVGTAQGAPRSDFQGRLSFSWPRTAGQFTLNQGKPGYDPLFPLGYGLGYAHGGKVGALDEAPGLDAGAANTTLFLSRAMAPAPFKLDLAPGLDARKVDSATTQEGALRLAWKAGQEGALRVRGAPLNWMRELNAQMVLQLTYRVEQAPQAPVTLELAAHGSAAGVPLNGVLAPADGQWHTLRVPLSCFAARGLDMSKVDEVLGLASTGPFAIALAEARLSGDPTGAVCPKD
ncbi:glycoside hydrolase family 3 protein [Sphingomonas sp. R3G8C]|uniref:glycoside hydrolase family 3 protein n=1 Tax=Novosphingobium rhizosphaerae TaxID=1551649 RepID=UPI0015CC7B86